MASRLRSRISGRGSCQSPPYGHLRDVRLAATDRARATQVAVANALNADAERIEKTTQVLNRTVGVAIG
jgi:primosomal protein N'